MKRTNNNEKEEKEQIKLEEEEIPEVEDIGHYQARMKRMKERLAASA